ncbi:hypothetical protein [Streptosporangium longisporum]|uniref:Outer membrane lipoprotein-sorting protein n=1 Tax=Streptosporangium longisporum TaxID=46187 RepID=A0ABN3XSI3_9ACTN
MRRWLALAAATLTASVPAAPAAAQTGPPDPAKAIQQQFRAHHGVQIAEISRTIYKDATSSRDRLTSRVQLGPTGPVAVDTSIRWVPDAKSAKAAETNELAAEMASPSYMTAVGGYLYTSGMYSLPQGKSWTRSELLRPVVDYASQQTTVNVLDPAALKTLLRGATVKPVSGGFYYQGTHAELKISWRLWTDTTGLPKRLLTNKRVVGEHRLAKIERIDTRYSDWGMPLVVVPPPADEVIDYEDLEDPYGSPKAEPKELITR